MPDTWDDFARVVQRAYADTGVTAMVERVRKTPPAPKGDRWWLGWVVEQLDDAERNQDWRHVLDMMAVLREVLKRGEVCGE